MLFFEPARFSTIIILNENRVKEKILPKKYTNKARRKRQFLKRFDLRKYIERIP